MPGSTIASAAMTWLMLQVPAMIEASPGALAPEPRALATTSKSPATTGVPSASPVAAAASAVTPPTMSVGPRSSGSMSTGVGEAVAFEQAGVVDAPRGRRTKPGAAHVGDVGDPAPGQAEGDEVLAEEGRAAARVDLRRVAAHPGEKRRRLRRPGLLQADRVQTRAVALGAQLLGKPRGAHVERLDREERRAAPCRSGRARCRGRRSRPPPPPPRPRRPSPGIRGSPRRRWSTAPPCRARHGRAPAPARRRCAGSPPAGGRCGRTAPP